MMEERLEKHRDFLVDRIDPNFGLLDKLRSNKTLTTEDVNEIKLNVNTTERKNRLLLDFILKKKKVDELVTALRDSGQIHLENYLNADGERRFAFGDDWPLSESYISRLDINRESLVDLLDTSDLCIRLFSEGVINNRQKQFISSKPTDAEKNEALLDMLTKCSLRQYKKTIDCLNDSNQSHIAHFLSVGGVLVRVHANLEGAVGNVDEQEEEIITQLTRVLENRPVEEATRLLELTQQRIVAARKGQSIVIYIHCTTQEMLQQLIDLLTKDVLKGIIERVFTKMCSRVDALRVTLTWSAEEFDKAATYLDRPPLLGEANASLLKGQSATPNMGKIAERKSSEIKESNVPVLLGSTKSTVFKMAATPGSHYYITSQLNGMVLDVEHSKTTPGAPVSMWQKSDSVAQFFYDHIPTGTIRSMLNEYCLDIEGGRLVLNPYEKRKEDQQWERQGHLIVNRKNRNFVLTIAGSDTNPRAKVIKDRIKSGDKNQGWTFELGP